MMEDLELRTIKLPMSILAQYREFYDGVMGRVWAHIYRATDKDVVVIQDTPEQVRPVELMYRALRLYNPPKSAAPEENNWSCVCFDHELQHKLVVTPTFVQHVVMAIMRGPKLSWTEPSDHPQVDEAFLQIRYNYQCCLPDLKFGVYYLEPRP